MSDDEFEMCGRSNIIEVLIYERGNSGIFGFMDLINAKKLSSNYDLCDKPS